MITYYFDENLRQIILSPGNQSPVASQTWTFNDNYYLQVYVCAGGVIQPIASTESISAILFQQPTAPVTPPLQELAAIGSFQILTDPNGNQYFQLDISLATTQLAALVQTPYAPATCLFHFVLNPDSVERFSQSQDITTIVNPDPTVSAAGTSPVPPGYPPSPNVFELIAHKGAASGYAPLNASGVVPNANLPAIGLGDMTKAVYDTGGTASPTGIVKTAAAANAAPWSGLTGTQPPPVGHGSTHLLLGSDAIPLATQGNAAGLCPAPDGTTVQITGSGAASRLVVVTGFPAANVRARQTTAQTLTTALAALTFQAIDFQNPGSWISAPGAQLVIPVAGIYKIGAFVTINNATFGATNFVFAIVVTPNTGTAIGSGTIIAEWQSTPAVGTPGYSLSTIYSLSANQVVQAGAYGSPTGLNTLVSPAGQQPSLYAFRIA